MMESFGKFIRRKAEDTGSLLYRNLVFPFVKMTIERKSDSIIGKKAYLFKGTTLEGKNHIGDGALLANTSVGTSTYIGPDSNISNARIGRFCCIAGLETAIGRHPVKGENISVHPAFYSKEAQYGYTFVNGTSFEEVRYTDKNKGVCIDIGNDVWIGRGVMITDGVTVGDGAVVGAKSLVTSDIEPYSIYAGIPAKKIGTRFDDDTVIKLLELKWWDKDEAWLKDHAGDFDDPELFFKTDETDFIE